MSRDSSRASSRASVAALAGRAKWALLAGALLALPSLSVGWFYDDQVHHAVLDGELPARDAGPLELYEFVDGPETAARLRDAHRLPWFAADALRVRFFRPLPSGLRALERSVFGEHAAPAHALSIALFLVWLLAAFALFEEIEPARAPLATLVFACAGAHGLAVGWVAARCALLVGICTCLALRAYLRATRGRSPWSAAGWLGLGLLSGEAALATLAFVGAHVALAGRARASRTLRAALPLLWTGAIFAVLHTALGFGADGSALYLNPLRDPLGFAAAGPERVAVLLADLTLGLPSGVLFLTPQLRSVGWALGLAGLALVVLATAITTTPRDRRRLSWLWVGAAVSLVLASSAIPEGRLLGLASVAMASTTAAILTRARALLFPSAVRGARRVAIVGALCASGLVAFGVGPMSRVAVTMGTRGVADAQARLRAPLDRAPLERAHADAASGSSAEPRYTFLLNADDVLLWLYAPIESPDAERLVPLGAVPGDVTVVLLDERTLELRADSSASILDSALTGLVRARPLAAGDRVQAGELSVEVLEPAPSLRLRFTFRRALQRGRDRLVEWDGAALVPVELEVGRPHRVAHRPGPSAGGGAQREPSRRTPSRGEAG